MIDGSLTELIWNTNKDSSIWFYSGAFMIILGAYIVEPFFTKPSDAIANSTAILIALFGLSSKQDLWGYSFIFYYTATVLFLSIVTIAVKDAQTEFLRKVAGLLYWFVETFGASKVIFSIIYLSASYSYFAASDKLIAFISIIGFWICLTFFDVIGLAVERVSRLTSYLNNKVGVELGLAIGCENPLLYKVEIDFAKHISREVAYGSLIAVETSTNIGSIGMVVDTKYLLNKKWLSVYLLQNSSREVLKISLKDKKLVAEGKSIFTKENLAYLLDFSALADETLKQQIESNLLYHDREQFIGYVSSGSNINTISFSIVREKNNLDQKITEGTILKTLIYGQETLYQVINGDAKEEHLENFDRHGFTIGIARKLGKYKEETKDLDVSKWMPSIFSPLFFAFSGEVSAERIKEIAQNAIGRLPDTHLEIPIKDIDALVTHNTAILGILGIGKSCLTFELLKKVIDESTTKVICVDITNEYSKQLKKYIEPLSVETDFDTKTLQELKVENMNGSPDDPTTWGNEELYRRLLDSKMKSFSEDPNLKVLVLNPDLHSVSKAGSSFKIQHKVDLTVSEKTRIITERLFILAKGLWDNLDESSRESGKARFLIVFEEAHSLIPEWNSTANEGDKSASNGTAKVILQGRKYGLGSFVVTQRTANISKSILNQCNTIFALRVFDDTGKHFLENYIGTDYADTLPTLEDRHAIAIGKGLMLKQPVIIQLNDRALIVQANPTIPEEGA